MIEQNEQNLEAARAYLEGRSAFPERAALHQLAGRFLTDFCVTVARWVEWSTQLVEEWPDDVTDAQFNVTAAEEGVRLAESINAMLDERADPKAP